jgi:tape measure domain-containing protein
MANIVDIIVNASDQATSTLNSIGGAFSNLSSKAEQASGLIMGGLGAIGVGLGVIAHEGAQYNAMLESSTSRWKTLTGSIEGANKQMDFISQYAKASPFDYQGVDETATALMGMGMQLKDVNKWIPTLGDMASVMGGGTETIQGVGRALGQMNALGRVSAEEMGQLAERGVNAWGMLAEGMDMPVAQVRKLSEDGKLLAKDALPLIYEGMNKAFGGGTQNFMKSTVGQAMQAEEAFKELSGTLTKGVYTYFGAHVLPLINKGMGFLNDTFKGGLIKGFQDLWNSGTKAKVILSAIASVIMGLLVGAIFLIAPAVAGAVVAFAPFIAIGAALTGVAILIKKNWGTIAPFFQSVWGGIKAGFEPVKTALVNGFNRLMEAFNKVKTVFQAVVEYVSGDAQTSFRMVADAFGTDFANKFWNAISYVHVAFNKFKGALDSVMTVAKAIVSYFQGDFTSAYGAVADRFGIDFANKFWDAILKVDYIINQFKIGFLDLKDKFLAALPTFEQVTNGIKAGWQFLVDAFNAAKPTILSVIDGLKQQFMDLWANLQPVLTQLKGLWDTLKEAFNSAIPIIKFLAAVVGVVLYTAFTIAIGIINGIIRAIAPLVSAIINVIEFVLNLGIAILKVFQGDFSGAFEYAKKALGSLLSAIGNILNAVYQFFVGFIQGVWSVIRPWAGELVEKFKTTMSNAGKAVSDWIGKMVQWFKEMPGKVMNALSNLASNLGSAFSKALDAGKNAVSKGIETIISTIKNWASTFVDAGKGLLNSFVDGIKSGISKAANAVSEGMSTIRKFLPFSPAKKGALSDLDKSGESFFPTWYNGALKKVGSMERAIGGAMGGLNSELASSHGSVGLEAFTGGRSKVTVVHRHEHAGTVKVQGDNGNKETLKIAGESVKETTENDVLEGLRQAIRKR